MLRRCFLVMGTVWSLFSIPQAAQAETITVFAAASTSTVLEEIGTLYAANSGDVIKGTYAASSTLAKQIEQGAPAQIFLSADQPWMDYLWNRNLIVENSPHPLLGNHLVLIAPKDSPLAQQSFTAKQAPDLLSLLGADGRLATGDPDHVPIGHYAEQALTTVGQWQALLPRLARAESVRAALALVERGEAGLGIVYATDAAASKGVKVIATIPDDIHDPVIYPVALVKGQDTPEARRFFAFLSSTQAKAIFKRAGFDVP